MTTKPERPAPMAPLREERTQVATYSWMRRHMGHLMPVVPFLVGALSWAFGLLQGSDPIKALKEYGVSGCIIGLLGMVIAYTFVVFIPKRDEAEEKTRQLLLASHADDRAAWAEDRAVWREALERVVDGLGERLGRVEAAVVGAEAVLERMETLLECIPISQPAAPDLLSEARTGPVRLTPPAPPRPRRPTNPGFPKGPR